MSSTVSRRLSQIAAQSIRSASASASSPSTSSSSSPSSLPPSSAARPKSPPLPTMARGRLQEPLILVCDIQEKFAKVIYQFDAVIATTKKLLDASDILGIPIAASMQTQAKLGATVSSLALETRKNFKCMHDKTLFSMRSSQGGDGGGDQLAALLKASDGKPRDVVLVGIETHICITQTALDLLEAGHRVYVLSDGVSSCNREEKPIALARLAREGVTVTTSESVLYEIMGDASIPEFRDIVKLVKETKEATSESLKVLHW